MSNQNISWIWSDGKSRKNLHIKVLPQKIHGDLLLLLWLRHLYLVFESVLGSKKEEIWVWIEGQRKGGVKCTVSPSPLYCPLLNGRKDIDTGWIIFTPVVPQLRLPLLHHHHGFVLQYQIIVLQVGISWNQQNNRITSHKRVASWRCLSKLKFTGEQKPSSHRPINRILLYYLPGWSLRLHVSYIRYGIPAGTVRRVPAGRAWRTCKSTRPMTGPSLLHSLTFLPFPSTKC